MVVANYLSTEQKAQLTIYGPNPWDTKNVIWSGA